MVWVTRCQLKTVHGYFYQERTRKTPHWKSVPCLEVPALFQSVADASHSSLMMKFLHGIFWSLFSVFPMFLKLRASENEEVAKPVPHYLYTHPMGFSVRKNKYIWASGDVSAHFCNCHFGPPPSEGRVVCSRPEGIWEGFRLGALVHLYMCRIVHVCTGVLKKQFCSLHTLKVMFTGVRIQFCSTGTRRLCRCPLQHLYISIRDPGAKDPTLKEDRCHGKYQNKYRKPTVYT